MFINFLKKDYMLSEEATTCGLALVFHLTLLLSKFDEKLED